MDEVMRLLDTGNETLVFTTTAEDGDSETGGNGGTGSGGSGKQMSGEVLTGNVSEEMPNELMEEPTAVLINSSIRLSPTPAPKQHLHPEHEAVENLQRRKVIAVSVSPQVQEILAEIAAGKKSEDVVVFKKQSPNEMASVAADYSTETVTPDDVTIAEASVAALPVFVASHQNFTVKQPVSVAPEKPAVKTIPEKEEGTAVIQEADRSAVTLLAALEKTPVSIVRSVVLMDKAEPENIAGIISAPVPQPVAVSVVHPVVETVAVKEIMQAINQNIAAQPIEAGMAAELSTEKTTPVTLDTGSIEPQPLDKKPALVPFVSIAAIIPIPVNDDIAAQKKVVADELISQINETDMNEGQAFVTQDVFVQAPAIAAASYDVPVSNIKPEKPVSEMRGLWTDNSITISPAPAPVLVIAPVAVKEYGDTPVSDIGDQIVSLQGNMPTQMRIYDDAVKVVARAARGMNQHQFPFIENTELCSEKPMDMFCPEAVSQHYEDMIKPLAQFSL
jgi:hypothetical protein